MARYIPTMYHRRLLLLGLITAGAMLPAAGQMFRLTVLEGSRHRAAAEGRLVTTRQIPNVRGRIVDRKGRVLATDRPTYDIAVDYDMITGKWATVQAARRARHLHADRWRELGPGERQRLADQALPEFQMRLDALWDQFVRLGGVSRADLEDRKNEIIREVQRVAANVWEAKRIEQAKQLAKEREISVDEAESEVTTGKVKRKIREELTAHVILRNVDDRIAFEFMRLAENGRDDPDGWMGVMAGIVVRDAGERVYPYETVSVDVDRSSLPGPLKSPSPLVVEVKGVATHVIGRMRDQVQREDIEQRGAEYCRRHGIEPSAYSAREDLGSYVPGSDSVGASGIEQGAEYDLRGMRGERKHHLDTDRVEVAPPVNGKTVRLALDVDLQAYTQALFDPSVGLAVVQPWDVQKQVDEHGKPRAGVPGVGDALDGAAVVIEIDTGDILALVTSPTYTREQLADDPESIVGDSDGVTVHSPYLNRAIGKAYAPGSIVKPVMLCAATTEGVYSPDERIPCNGHFLPNDTTKLRCWIYKMSGWQTHSNQLGHDLNGSDGIMCSCNIFFFTMGQRLGPKRLTAWYRKFNVDAASDGEAPWGLGIGPEFPGALGRIGSTEGPSPSEAIQMAIGQGPIAWTPLHAANAYATIGRGGVYVPPRIRTDADSTPRDLHIDPRAIDQALDGLRRGVAEFVGTTNHITMQTADGQVKREPIFNQPGVTVRAKSGTADASALLSAPDADGRRRVLRDGDHAWCVALVGPEGERPRYAVAVVVDYGGSGGRVAGPIVNQVIHALARYGYLPGAAEGGGTVAGVGRAERRPGTEG